MQYDKYCDRCSGSIEKACFGVLVCPGPPRFPARRGSPRIASVLMKYEVD